MKYKVFILATLFLLFTDCTSNTDTFTDRISGNYSGTFERNGVSTPIQITFDNGTFNGQSAVEKFPAICNGIYTSNGDQITFTNNCIWTADFDWTLILSEEWTFERDQSELTLTKANGDTYRLFRQ